MIDTKAFRSMSYGLYLISTLEGSRPVGCAVNTLVQVASEPPRVSVAINKENCTAQALQKTGRFVATVLSQDATMELIGAFGFHTSRDTDKFAGFATATDAAGVSYVSEQAVARFSAKVIETVDVGTHLLFIAEVEEAERLSKGEPMTYAYYHQVKGGKTPPKAPSYEAPEHTEGATEGAAAEGAAPEEVSEQPASQDAASGAGRIGWRCSICGYVIYQDELSEDFACPVCGVGREMFERFVEE